MEFFALRQCAMNRGFGDCFSSFIIGNVAECDVRKRIHQLQKVDRFHVCKHISILADIKPTQCKAC